MSLYTKNNYPSIEDHLKAIRKKIYIKSMIKNTMTNLITGIIAAGIMIFFYFLTKIMFLIR